MAGGEGTIHFTTPGASALHYNEQVQCYVGYLLSHTLQVLTGLAFTESSYTPVMGRVACSSVSEGWLQLASVQFRVASVQLGSG